MPIQPSRRRVTLSFPLLLFVAHPPATAADAGSPTLETVSIQAPQATGTSSPGQSGEQFDEADLAIGHERTVDEVLNGHSGIVVNKRGAHGLGTVTVRGAGGQGLLTWDGLPVPDSVPGVLNLNALIPDGLEQVQVSRGFGPASQAFSSLGGAVRLVSREARDNGADLRVEGGTFGFLKETARGTLAGEKGRIAVTANRSDAFDGSFHAQKSNDNPERDPFHSTQAMLRAGYDLSSDVSWDGSMLYRNSWNGMDSLGFRSGTLAMADEAGAFLAEENWMAQNSLTARLSADWSTRLQLGYTRTRNHAEGMGLELGYTTDLYLARWENDNRLWAGNDDDALHLVWGAEGRHERAEAPTLVPAAPFGFTPGTPFVEERSQQAGFVEARYVYGTLSGDVGVRYESYSQFDDHALLHAGAAWQFAPDWKLHANGGNGFRIPSYAERVFPLLGNLVLRPEKGAGGDLGVEWQPTPESKLDLTGFYSRYDDLIVLTWNPVPSAQIPCITQCLTNLANAAVAGIEASGEIAFSDQWRGGASYTYTDSRNLDNNRRVPFRPRDVVRLWGEWQVPALPVTLWAEGVYRGRAFNDVGNTLDVDDALRFNAQVDYQVASRLNLYVRGENLSNDKTPEAFSFDAPGAAVYGGVAWKL
ncbi:MAG TPA: TonB-dependent receptor [Methylococcaceae bacterium]|nr:TonB-dependent receptor [Methylococcaceae bacterium]